MKLTYITEGFKYGRSDDEWLLRASLIALTDPNSGTSLVNILKSPQNTTNEFY